MICRMVLLAAALAITACTETPGSFPPCVDPNDPCMLDASDGATADSNPFDVSVVQEGGGGDGAPAGEGAVTLDGGAGDATADSSVE